MERSSESLRVSDVGELFGAYHSLKQQSPHFLASGTGFVEDNFSTDQGGGRWCQDDSSALHSSSPTAVRPGS